MRVDHFVCDYAPPSSVRTEVQKRKQAPVKVRNIVFSIALVFSATACGGGSDDAFMEKSDTLMEGMAKVVEKAGDDCGKMADGLADFVKKNEGALKDMKEKAESMKKDKAAMEKMAKAGEKYKDRLAKAMPAMMSMMKCTDDPKFKEIEGKLSGFGL